VRYTEPRQLETTSGGDISDGKTPKLGRFNSAGNRLATLILATIRHRVLFSTLFERFDGTCASTIRPEASDRIHWTKVLVIPRSNEALNLLYVWVRFASCLV